MQNKKLSHRNCTKTLTGTEVLLSRKRCNHRSVFFFPFLFLPVEKGTEMSMSSCWEQPLGLSALGPKVHRAQLLLSRGWVWLPQMRRWCSCSISSAPPVKTEKPFWHNSLLTLKWALNTRSNPCPINHRAEHPPHLGRGKPTTAGRFHSNTSVKLRRTWKTSSSCPVTGNSSFPGSCFG